jgi:hypothetical protein
MNEQESLAAECKHLGGGKVGKKASLVGAKCRDTQWASRSGEIAEASNALNLHFLSNAVIVVSPDTISRVLPNPLDTGARFGTVIDQVADTHADIERFLDCLQGRTISVDVRNDQYSHCPHTPIIEL